MQIDELPAGEQTQNPDLDMNQVVGTHDISKQSINIS